MKTASHTPQISSADAMKLRPSLPFRNGDGSNTCSIKDGTGQSIGFVDGETMDEAMAFAEKICRAVNSHDALVSALKECLRVLHEDEGYTFGNNRMMNAARTALSLANS